MPVVRDFRELKVWEKFHYLTLAIYRVTQNFPEEETYGLTCQMRRGIRFNSYLVKDLHYMHQQEYDNLNLRVIEVKKML